MFNRTKDFLMSFCFIFVMFCIFSAQSSCPTEIPDVPGDIGINQVNIGNIQNPVYNTYVPVEVIYQNKSFNSTYEGDLVITRYLTMENGLPNICGGNNEIEVMQWREEDVKLDPRQISSEEMYFWLCTSGKYTVRITIETFPNEDPYQGNNSLETEATIVWEETFDLAFFSEEKGIKPNYGCWKDGAYQNCNFSIVNIGNQPRFIPAGDLETMVEITYPEKGKRGFITYNFEDLWIYPSESNNYNPIDYGFQFDTYDEGVYSVNINTDIIEKIPENNEGNNAVIFDISVLFPDLTFGEISCGNDFTGKYVCQVPIYNIGNGDVYLSGVWSKDDQLVYSPLEMTICYPDRSCTTKFINIQGYVDSGMSMTAEIPIESSQVGVHGVYFQVNPYHEFYQFYESDFGNNSAQVALVF